MSMRKRKLSEKILVFFLCFFIVLGNLYIPEYVKANAAGISGTDNLLYDLEGNKAVITGVRDTSVTRVHIPRKIDGVIVTGIADRAFLYNRNLIEVTLPDTLTYIGQQAFSMTSIKKIEIPGSVKTIKLKAFQNCQSLEKVTIYYGVQSIEDGAFASCTRLSVVEIAPSVGQMKSNTFNHVAAVEIQAEPDSPAGQFNGNAANKIEHKKLEDDSSVVYAYNTDEYGNVTIKDYHGSSETPIIPDTINGNVVTKIGDGAFQDKPVKEVRLPDSITNIGSNAFAGTNIEYLFIPKGVTSLGDNIIDNKDNLVIESESEAVEEYISKYFPDVRFVPYGPGMTSYHMLTINTNGSGYITKGVTAKYKNGKDVKIAALPYKKYAFVKWISSGEGTFADSTKADTIFKMPNTEVTITAIFEKLKRPDFVYTNGVLKEYNIAGELIIPETYAKSDTDATKVPVTAIEPDAFCHYDDGQWYYGYPTRIEIPASMATIPNGVFKTCYSLADITVKENNPNFKSVDGVLFNKDMTELLAYPRSKKGESYTVPDTVTKIAPYAFYQCYNLTSIKLSKELEEIGYQAFESCNYIRTVTMPALSKLKTIGSNAFDSCIRLERFTIPKSVVSIGTSVFNGCSVLEAIAVEAGNIRYSDDDGVLLDNDAKSLLCYPRMKTNITYTVPDTIEKIEHYAFYQASRLKDIILPQSIKEINTGAFESASDLENINIPDGVTKISSDTFRNCVSLKQINLPKGITRIDTYAFSRCLALKQINLPENLLTIGLNAFNNCSSLESITIPESVTVIDSHVFANCTSLTQVVLPRGLKQINGYAFMNCKSLTEIEIFENVNKITPFAFYNCTGLKEFKVVPSNENYSQLSGVLFNKNQTSLVCYPIARESENGKYVIPTGTKDILEEAFANTKLEEIDIPQETTSIGYKAFTYCSNLKSLIIRNKDAVLQYGTNRDCLIYGTNKNNLVISGYIDSTAEYFAYIHNLKFRQLNDITKDLVVNANGEVIGYTGSETKILLPSTVKMDDGTLVNVTSIGKNAFKNPNNVNDTSFRNITEVKLPLSITTIKDSAFDGMISLTNLGLILPESIQTIGAYAFNGCTGLTEMTIPKNVSVLNSSAFSECSNLTAIHVAPENINYADIDGVVTNKAKTELQYMPISFTGKDGVYDMPDSIVSMKAGAMLGCKGINTINMTNLDVIDQGAFRGAFTETVEINLSNVKDIDNFAFADCDGITTITIPETVIRIGDGVFSGCNNLKEINVDSNNEKYVSKNGVLLTKDGIALVSYPKGKPDTFYQVPEGIRQIYDNAFYACKNLGEIKIPESVSMIGVSAFEECSFMSIELPQKLELIGDKAFSNNTMLLNISIPEHVTNIGAYAFYGCSKLSDVTVYSKTVVYSNLGEIFNQDMMGDMVPLLTLRGYLGSTTEQYTKGRNINFEALDSSESEIPVISGGAIKDADLPEEDNTAI